MKEKAKQLILLSEDEWGVLLASNLGQVSGIGDLASYLELFKHAHDGCVKGGALKGVMISQNQFVSRIGFSSMHASHLNRGLKSVGFPQYVVRVADSEGQRLFCERIFRFGKKPT